MPADKRPKRPAKKSSPKKTAAVPTPADATMDASVEATMNASVDASQRSADSAPHVAPDARPDTRAVLTFRSSWQQDQQGDITAGGSLVVRYEPARLEAPRASRVADTMAGGEIVGWALFAPGGEIRQASLHSRPADGPSDPGAAPVSAEIPIPAQTEHVELWFARTDPTGATAWDSRFGANYRYAVARGSALV